MRRAVKVDSVARELTQTARQLGAKVIPLNGIVDALVLHRNRVFIVDWKSSKKIHKHKDEKTARQTALGLDGWPIHYVQDASELKKLLGVGG